MKLAELTWPEVDALSRREVILIPTGSLEQHGRHLPLFTDSILATSIAEAVETKMSSDVLLTPTLWLGASAHHLAYAGSLSASFDSYIGSILAIAESLIPHRFTKFFIINGHGGNSEPNGIAMRTLKAKYTNLQFGHANYYSFAEDAVAGALEGPDKKLQHACEAESSLVMHLRPELVRKEKLRNDGLKPEGGIKGMIHHFDEISEDGSIGYSPLASAEKGKAIFDAAVVGLVQNLRTLVEGYVFEGS